MYGSRAVTLLVLISADVINWILKPYIQTNILVYMALDVSTTLPVKLIRRGILASCMWYYKAVIILTLFKLRPLRNGPRLA